MTQTCKGCGAVLQMKDKTSIGYVAKEGQQYCQRCFRITHYDDVVISMKQSIDSEEVLKKIHDIDALFLWVVDLFDFEANIIRGLNRHLKGKDIVMVATKRDLLPDTLSDKKLCDFIMERMKFYDISIQGVVIVGDLAAHADSDDNNSCDEIWNAVASLRHNRDVVVMGMANAGKSTMLNAMLGYSELTTSRYPGTTLDVNQIAMDGYTLYDTPGLTRYDSLLTHVEDTLLKSIIPYKQVKQRGYQLKEDQTLSLGGLVRLDLLGCEQVSCVAYFSERLPLHRGKTEKADQLWEQHLHELLSPSLDEKFQDMKVYNGAVKYEKMDVVIHGLGWFCISGKVKQLRVYVNEHVNVTFRKAMI